MLNIAARVGGDEFVQVVTGVDNIEEAAKVAEDILDGFTNAGLHRFIGKYNVGLSIGVALCPHHTQNFHVLIKYADVAMYQAKRNGKNQYCVYWEGMEKGSC